MKKLLSVVLFVAFTGTLSAQSIFDKSELTAWCIVPFDSKKRNPAERIAMLQELGIKQYAYDWREEHIPSFAQEITLAKEANIAVEGVWLWIDGKGGQLSTNNLKIIEIAKKAKLKTDFWLGFNYNFFEGLTHHEKVDKGSELIKSLAQIIEPMDANILLYNHGDWFGEPENQIEIIQHSGLQNIGICYSFHHGHAQYNRFHSLLNTMLPYLKVINLNGMDISKNQILSIGQGKNEEEMIKMISSSEYKGRIGVLGHKMDEDVAEVLTQNIQGLNEIAKKLKL